MSRFFGVSPLTTRSPMRTVPSLISSRPAAIRSAVVLPQPDGPTSTTNSPSAISRSRPSTARVPSLKTLVTFSKATLAMGHLLLDRAADETANECALAEHEDDRDRYDCEQRRERELRLEDLNGLPATAD